MKNSVLSKASSANDHWNTRFEFREATHDGSRVVASFAADFRGVEGAGRASIGFLPVAVFAEQTKRSRVVVVEALGHELSVREASAAQRDRLRTKEFRGSLIALRP